MFLKRETDKVLVEQIINKQLPPVLDYLETQIPAQGYIFGELMIADISLVMPFINAGYAGYIVDAERWPLFANFVERIKSHPLVKPLLAAEASMLGLA